MRYILILVLLLLQSCALFEIKMEEIKNKQLTCSPADSSMCAGWKVEEN